MKKDKNTIKLFEKIINWDFSDALKMQCKHALTIYKNANSVDEISVFYSQFFSLIHLCEYYTKS